MQISCLIVKKESKKIIKIKKKRKQMQATVTTRVVLLYRVLLGIASYTE